MGRKKSNHVHEYVDFDTESNTSKCLIEGCDTVLKGNHSSNLLRHFAVHHGEAYSEIMFKNNSLDDNVDLSNIVSAPLKAKKSRLDIYHMVKQCCIDLVKVHGRPLSLFDDAAFKELISLIPITSNEKHKISSKGIAKALVNDADDKEITPDENSKPNTIERGLIKGENMLDCTCNASSDDDIVKHTVDCAIAGQQPYFNYFEVQVDMATCSLCKQNFNWSNGSDLKEHLNSKHSTVPFKDDDEEFERGAPQAPDSSVDSGEGMQEIYLDENILNETVRTLGKTKRSNPLSLKKVNTYTEASSNWSGCLDRFGLYISGLMKFLPREKCIKFQSQIVQRLLHEQATAA